MKKVQLSVFLLSFSLLISGCKSTPVPTGDQLVSVSWVNPSPVPLHSLSAKVCGSNTPVILEQLPAYSELAVETSRPLYKNCRVENQVVAGKDNVMNDSLTLEVPLRRSASGEYNLRIQLRRGLPAKFTLEPIELTRERLQN